MPAGCADHRALQTALEVGGENFGGKISWLDVDSTPVKRHSQRCWPALRFFLWEKRHVSNYGPVRSAGGREHGFCRQETAAGQNKGQRYKQQADNRLTVGLNETRLCPVLSACD